MLKVGMKHVSSDEELQVLAALGVNHILANMPSASSTRAGPQNRSTSIGSGRTHGSAST
jgi:hypothetical protein